MDNEAMQERIAIKMDSGIHESEATRQAKSELPKVEPESVSKARQLQAKQPASRNPRIEVKVKAPNKPWDLMYG